MRAADSAGRGQQKKGRPAFDADPDQILTAQ